MSEWYFAEQQSLYRRQTLMDEAARNRILAQAPQTSIRERVAGALIAVAVRLAPTATTDRIAIAAAQLSGKHPLTGIIGS